VVIGLTSLVVVVVVTLALMALRSSCRTSASALLTVGVGLDQYVALAAKVLAILSCGLHLRRSSHFFTTNSLYHNSLLFLKCLQQPSRVVWFCCWFL